MRAAPTPAEEKLWQRLRDRQLGGFKFSRQIVIERFICDFVCRDRTLIIEVDGDTHDQAADADRDYYLGRMGYRVLRFTNVDVGSNLSGVLEVILEVARGRPTKIERLGGRTTPLPPPLAGRGSDVALSPIP
jgi:very-short-patch-repair endonuclease